MFPGSAGSPAQLALEAKIAEEGAARRAAIPPLAALKQLDTRIATLTKREGKPPVAVARQREELAVLETELAIATAERSAAAARVAIPSATDIVDLETVAHSTIQTRTRVSEIAGDSATAAPLRERIQQSVALIRAPADEAVAAVAAASSPLDRSPEATSSSSCTTRTRTRS